MILLEEVPRSGEDVPQRARAFEEYLAELRLPYRRDDVEDFSIFTGLSDSALATIRRAQSLPVPLAAYRVEWLDVPNPGVVRAGTLVTTSVRVRNASNYLWSPAFHVGAMVRRQGSPPGENVSSARGLPDRWTNPGESIEVPVTIRAPSTPGLYQLVYDMVFENVAWFSDRGGMPHIVPLEVR